MMDELSKNLCSLKQKFAQTYHGSAHIQEVIPTGSSEKFPIGESDLESLHMFAEKNPIYYNSYHDEICNIPCMVYEGDINEYWLNSIKHGSSCQPFYPTWVLSAYVMTLAAKNMGFQELIDIGSGDGRIAYCGEVLGLDSHGIEIDDALVELQKMIASLTGVDFDPRCADALDFDFSVFELARPVFFIGGLPQMGGDVLAASIIEKINSFESLRKNTCLVFAGSHSKRHLSGNQESGGWSSLMDRHNLKEVTTVSLPTVWTFDQPVDTPYIYTNYG